MNYQRGVMSSVLQPVTKSVLGSVFDASAGVAQPDTWSPASLFANGENGAWYDPSDLSTMFQDAAGTLPVTSEGQPIGRLLDKSGNGNHATQPTTTARPILSRDAVGRLFISFDGVDDSLIFPNQSLLSNAGGASFFVAFEAVDSANANPFLYFSNGVNGGQVRCSFVFGPAGSKYLRISARRLDSDSTANRDTAPIPNGKSFSTFAINYNQANFSIRNNGIDLLSSSILSPGVTSSTPSAASYIGWNSGTTRNMCPIYGMIIRLPIVGSTDVMRAESYMANKLGVIA